MATDLLFAWPLCLDLSTEDRPPPPPPPDDEPDEPVGVVGVVGVEGEVGVVGAGESAARVMARVVTALAVLIRRIVELPLSATYRFPVESTRNPRGWLNSASKPVPSCWPEIVGKPAIVVTTPAGVMRRMVELPESAT